jgi:hypothetical protein
MQLYFLFGVHVLLMQLMRLQVKPSDKILIQLTGFRCQFRDLIFLLIQHVLHNFHGFDQKLTLLLILKHVC